jgi:peptidoglycan/xylan/chitin deacetylase (PgdA/CDA1 family)
LVQNGILWAAGRVTAHAASWPQGKRAALLLVQDVEAEYQNAVAMAELLRDLGVPGTFFAVSRMVEGETGLATALTEVGEVGSQTSDHTPVAGLSYQDQVVRLRRSRTEITNWAGKAPPGLRPPEEAFDENTLRAWAYLGGDYVMAVNQARSASPEIFRFENGTQVVLLPRLIKDDYNVFVQEGALRSDRLSTAFLDGTEKLRAIGGLAVVAVHTQIVGTGTRLGAIGDVVSKAKADGDWWIAPAGEVANWWRGRAQVKIEFVSHPSDLPPVDSLAAQSAPGETIHILVTAPEEMGLTGLWIDVGLPAGLYDLTPSLDGDPVSYSRTDWGMRIPIDRLSPGQTRSITFQGVSPEARTQGGK